MVNNFFNPKSNLIFFSPQNIKNFSKLMINLSKDIKIYVIFLKIVVFDKIFSDILIFISNDMVRKSIYKYLE